MKSFFAGIVVATTLLISLTAVLAHVNSDNSANMIYRMILGREATTSEKSNGKSMEVDQLVDQIMGGGRI